uniref:Ig-like domain-containing protein n=2 Tax=Amphiprion ocellaris TaxID=80972 RepID=A0AAQ5YBC8_AMPOC
MKKFIQRCSNSPTLTCSIQNSFVSDSGQYWCENAEQRSNAVSINVTAGSVILESPVHPIMEGEAVTLGCRHKTTSSNFTADFYKDGRLTGSSSTGNLTIRRLSKSDEGLYKCMSGHEVSPESWLAVRSKSNTGGGVTPENPVNEDSKGSVKQSQDSNTQQTHKTVVFPAANKQMTFLLHIYVLLWVSIAVVLTLQLLVLGLLYWKRQLVLLEIQMTDPSKDLDPVPNKVKKNKDAADSLSLDFETNHSKNPEKDEDEFLPQTFQSTHW